MRASLLGLSILCAACAGTQPQPVAEPGLGLRAAILVERRAAGRIDALMDGDALETGDGLRLAVELDRPAHVLAIHLDSQGQASQLFPDPAIALLNPLPAGQALDIPLAGNWFTLEGEPGLEGIYLLASPGPFADAPGLIARLAALGPGWSPEGADRAVAEHLTRGGVRRTHRPGGPAPAEAHARTPGDEPRVDRPPPPASDRPRPFRRPMLIAGVVRGQGAAGELREVLATGGVEVRALTFLHR
jgi:hypothetical protein